MGGHLGHFVLVQTDPRSGGVRLFWTSLGGGTWHEVDGIKDAKLTRDGTSGYLVISAGVVCELMTLFVTEQRRADACMRLFQRQTYDSHWTSTWKAVA